MRGGGVSNEGRRGLVMRGGGASNGYNCEIERSTW